jgi:hypothetical protein
LAFVADWTAMKTNPIKKSAPMEQRPLFLTMDATASCV